MGVSQIDVPPTGYLPSACQAAFFFLRVKIWKKSMQSIHGWMDGWCLLVLELRSLHKAWEDWEMCKMLHQTWKLWSETFTSNDILLLTNTIIINIIKLLYKNWYHNPVLDTTHRVYRGFTDLGLCMFPTDRDYVSSWQLQWNPTNTDHCAVALFQKGPSVLLYWASAHQPWWDRKNHAGLMGCSRSPEVTRTY